MPIHLFPTVATHQTLLKSPTAVAFGAGKITIRRPQVALHALYAVVSDAKIGFNEFLDKKAHRKTPVNFRWKDGHRMLCIGSDADSITVLLDRSLPEKFGRFSFMCCGLALAAGLLVPWVVEQLPRQVEVLAAPLAASAQWVQTVLPSVAV